jgi:cold shock CspA family protein
MRLTGVLRSWNEDRGYGFIAPTHGGREVFVHVSALPRGGTRPAVGERLSYELARNGEGKWQAVHVVREALVRSRAAHGVAAASRPRRPLLRPILAAAVVGMVGAIAYGAYTQRPSPLSDTTAPGTAAPREPSHDRSQEPSVAFRCDGRTHCSQMTSCTEAKFFLANCPGTKMDGDGDGVPCERQWCTGR